MKKKILFIYKYDALNSVLKPNEKFRDRQIFFTG